MSKSSSISSFSIEYNYCCCDYINNCKSSFSGSITFSSMDYADVSLLISTIKEDYWYGMMGLGFWDLWIYFVRDIRDRDNLREKDCSYINGWVIPLRQECLIPKIANHVVYQILEQIWMLSSHQEEIIGYHTIGFVHLTCPCSLPFYLSARVCIQEPQF